MSGRISQRSEKRAKPRCYGPAMTCAWALPHNEAASRLVFEAHAPLNTSARPTVGFEIKTRPRGSQTREMGILTVHLNLMFD